MDLKHLIYEDEVIAVGLISSRSENAKEEITVTAQVNRLERNAAHPQVALNLVEGMRVWKKEVWELAGELAGQTPDEGDDW